MWSDVAYGRFDIVGKPTFGPVIVLSVAMSDILATRRFRPGSMQFPVFLAFFFHPISLVKQVKILQ